MELQTILTRRNGNQTEIIIHVPTDKAIEDSFNKTNLDLEVLTIDKACSESLRCFGIKDPLDMYLRFNTRREHNQFNTSSSPYEEGFRYSFGLSGKDKVMDFLKEMGITGKCFPGLEISELKGKRVAVYFDDKGYARAVSPINQSLGGTYFDKFNYIRSVFIDKRKKLRRV